MVRVTDRDVRLLAVCAAAQWLTTGQIQRLFFPHATLDAVRKRLRKLSDDGYLRSSQPHRMAELLHGIGRKGQLLLADKGWDVHQVRKAPEHLEHAVGINDLRIAVESSPWRVRYFFAHWELGQFRWQHPVIPDAVFSVDVPKRMTIIAEYDRGTESGDVLARKLRQYDAILGDFHFDAVLLVTDAEAVAARYGRALAGRRRFAAGMCCLRDIQGSGFAGRIFSLPGQLARVTLLELVTAADEDS